MKQPQKYQNRARRYRVLAKGYAALKSKLAQPVESAAKSFEQMAAAHEAEVKREIADARSSAASQSR